MPSLKQKIAGCAFAGRCPMATDLCRQVAPALEEKAPGHVAACHYAEGSGDAGGMSAPTAPLLDVTDLKKHFPMQGGLLGGTTGHVYAVDGVSFHIARGETLSLVGEVGLRQVDRRQGHPAAVRAHRRPGRARRQADRRPARPAQLRPLRRRVQVVFQDPVLVSLNPRMRVRDIMAEPMRNFGLAKDASDLERRASPS